MAPPRGNQNRRKYPINDEDSFIEIAINQKTDDCIIWPYGYKGKYGYISREDIPKLVIKIVCEKIYGLPSTPKHEPAHNCGNVKCINWKHLRWATHKENHADRVIHGTLFKWGWSKDNDGG
jgi:HNH endonuclease